MFGIKEEVKSLLDEYKVEIIALKKVLMTTNQLLVNLNDHIEELVAQSKK